jgi:AraC-like DNA-binding protein
MLRRGGQEYLCAAGTVMVLPMPDRHRYWLPRGGTWEYAYASLRGAAPLRACAQLLAGRGPVLQLHDDAPLAQTVLTTVADCLVDEGLGPHAISERGYALAMRILELSDAGEERRHLPPDFADIEVWCRSHVQGLSVADLAKHLGQSREHLTRQFTRACARSPGRFLADLRLEIALKALRSGATLAEATVEAGLRSQAGLRRALRRQLGWAPS